MGTIAEEISALRGRISQAYDVIDQKGGDVPFDRTSWNLSASIDSIRVEGGTDPAAIVPVEYLRSTGTQYIDTEAFITNNWENRLEIYIDYQFDGVPTENERIWGALSSTSNGPYYQAFQNYAATPFQGFQCGGGNIFSMTTGFGDRYRVDVRRTGQNPYSLSAYSVQVNGSLSNITTFDYAATMPYSPYLFARNLAGEVQNGAKGKLFRYVHKQRGETIRDMIPVRVGDVGYMYDIPTGRLFGNKGTGAFSFGLDKIPILSDAVEIEYIEFSGTQYIDTGIMPTSTTGAQLDFNLTNKDYTRGLFGETGPSLFAGGGSFSLYPGLVEDGATIPAYIVAYGGYTTTTISLPLNTRAIHHLNYMNSGTAGVQGYFTKTLGTSGALQGYNLWIGALNCGGWRNMTFVAAGRLYSCKITNGTTLVRDFVPVRIGDTGYLYDRVSQSLFGNCGDGSFGLGPDVG